MPWQEVSIVDQRREFVRLAMQDGANRRELCRRFGIHLDTGYKWLDWWAGGDEELRDRSRRPHSSPTRSEAATEARVLSVRDAHPAWGARKIARRLQDDGLEPPAHVPGLNTCPGNPDDQGTAVPQGKCARAVQYESAVPCWSGSLGQARR
jgi:hypothetical protein